MDQTKTGAAMSSLSIKRNVLIGVLALVPIWITLTLMGLFLSFIRDQASPLIDQVTKSLGPSSPAWQAVIDASWFQTFIAVVFLLLFFYVVGWLTSQWIGRQTMQLIDNVVARIPIAKSIYRAVKGITDAMQSHSSENDKVVLVDFPSSGLRSFGLVVKVTKDSVTGEDLAIVFVPTSPNPTSGFVEISPLSALTFTNWTVEEAMSFLMSGGVDLPSSVTITRNQVPAQDSD